MIALVGLALREPGLRAGLAPRGSAGYSVSIGVAMGATAAGLLWLVRRYPALEQLERWQRKMVSGWSATDAIAVAVFSGLAEEALIRALLQPIIGLVPAALLFAVLHLVPDRRLWLWPVLALLLGLVLGLAFRIGGYPAAAAAHLLINGLE
ncbi:MAG: CPBP family glutamic-type intramembrane protease [Acidobacteriota bacterium]